MPFSEGRIPKIIAFFRIIHLIFSIIGILLIIWAILVFFLSGDPQLIKPLPFMVFIVVYSLAIYIGLRRLRSWVVPVLIIVSTLSLVFGLFSFGRASPSLYLAIARAIGFALNIFTLYFFTRKEVRDFFKVSRASS